MTSELGRYKIPVEYAELERDIERLEQVEHILRHIDSRNCSTDIKTGFHMHRHLLDMVRLCRSQAQRKARELLKKSS